jgi:hypothetical protein
VSGEVQHYIQKTDTTHQLHLPFCFSNGIPCNPKTINVCSGGLDGWSCCQVDSKSGAISPNLWIQTQDGLKATGDGLSLMAAWMMRVQRTMG